MNKIKLEEIKSMSFEDAMTELDKVVRQLEDGKAPLETAIEIYEQGDALKKHCDALLNKAKLKVEEIYKSKEGNLSVKDSPLNDLFS